MVQDAGFPPGGGERLPMRYRKGHDHVKWVDGNWRGPGTGNGVELEVRGNKGHGLPFPGGRGLPGSKISMK